MFSPAGTRIAFERLEAVDGDLRGGHLFVAGSDGSSPIQLTTEPIRVSVSSVGDPYQFSPDGKWLVVAPAGDPLGPSLLLLATDGSTTRRIDLGTLADRVTSVTEPTFRPPDGREILFVGTDEDSGNGGPGIYAVDPASGDVRTIVEAAGSAGMDLATWSPDGSQLSYATWDTDVDALTVRTHVIGADGSGDRVLPAPDGMGWDVGAAWSNDGTRLLLVRGDGVDWLESRPAIVPADGSGVGTDIDYGGPIQGGCCFSWEWAPDDSMVIGKPISTSGGPLQQVIVDVASGTIREAPWTTAADPVMQRRAR
jgi:hypothetical protein